MVQTSLFDVDARSDALHRMVDESRDRILADLERRAGERFRDAARAFILAELAKYATGQSAEILTLACRTAGIAPPNGMDDRAFGPVYMALAKRGRIVKVGTVRRERGHGTAGGNIWMLARREDATVS